MAKKIKKKKMEFPAPTQDTRLDDVEEDRSLEIEYDEETNEVVLVCHYRRHWGDGFDADTEHLFKTQENEELIAALLNLLNVQRKVDMAKKTIIEEKSTLDLIEGNPIKETKLENESKQGE